MKKRTFLSKFAAKCLAVALTVSSVLLTGCYRDDGLDVNEPGGGTTVVPDAAYSISGSVTNVEGQPVNLTEVTANPGTSTILANGGYVVSLSKSDVPEGGRDVTITFKAEGYVDAVRTVHVDRIADGSTIVYPLSVVMQKPAVNYVDVVYDLEVIAKNAETGEKVDVKYTVQGEKEGNYYKNGTVVITTEAVDGQFYSSVTSVELPKLQVKEGENNVKKQIVEVEVRPVAETPDPEKVYVNISGVVLNKNGKALAADKIELLGADGSVKETVSNVSEFRFTVLKEDVTYSVKATYGGYTATSTSVNANGGNYDCVLVFDEVGEDASVKLKYELDVNIIDAETRSAIAGAEWDITGGKQAQYEAGIYTITATADGYNPASVKVALDVVYGKNGDVVYRVITVEMTKKPQLEFVKIYGEVKDKRGILATAQIIRLEGANIQSVYNASSFAFSVKNVPGKYKVVAEIKNANESGIIPTAGTIEITEGATDAYYVLLQFPVVVENGKEVIEEGDGATGSVTPDIEDGVVQETETNIMSDGTTLVLEEGTQTNLGEQTLVLVRNTSEETTDESSSSDGSAVLRSYIGLPNGTTFNPGLKVMFADAFGGQLGNSFELQYQAADGSWAADNQGGNVTLANGVYTMDIRHFSAFRASMNLNPQSSAETLALTEVIDVNRMNNSDQELAGFELRYNGKAGVKYADFAKLEADIANAFSNKKAQNLVKNAIQALCPTAGIEFDTREYVGYATIPAWTLLNTVDIKTTTKTTTYTITVSEVTITFAVEEIVSVEVSATDKNMTHIGHSHGHGHGDLNNAGGGIVVAE